MDNLRNRLARAGRDAHGSIPFHQKPIWQEGYDECKRQIFAALEGEEDRLRDLESRIARTLDYTDSLVNIATDMTTISMCGAIRYGLTTPVRNFDV